MGTNHRIPRDAQGRRLPCAICDFGAAMTLDGIPYCFRHWTYAMGWTWRVPIRYARPQELRKRMQDDLERTGSE